VHRRASGRRGTRSPAQGATRRGSDEDSGRLFIYVELETPVRRDHPRRAIREIGNPAVATLAPDFSEFFPRQVGLLSRLKRWRISARLRAANGGQYM